MINIAIKLATSITYTADGSQTNFSVPFDYLRPSFVHVAVNDAEVSEGFTISNRMVMFDSAPAKDAVVHIYRSTPTTRLVSWADASILKAIDMTIAEVQQLHILEEGQDWSKTNSIILDRESGAWQGRNYRISNITDPTEAQDVVTKHYLENTEDSFVQRMNTIKTQTEQFANTAGNSKDSAYKSAQSASLSAASAAESAKLAEGYKNIAETAKSNASLYAANAKTSADNAGASKEAAQSAATTASNFASAARNSAGEAKTYKDNAKTYMDNAKTYMDNAKNYSENVNVFVPSVSSAGVLSWTNKAGLTNPKSVNIKGAKGDTGTAATITIGSVTTGAPGTNVSVTNSGTSTNAILNFTIPRGQPGAGGGTPVEVDAALSATSLNPVQNKVIKAALDNKVNKTDTIYEANLGWGGRNIADGYSPTDAAMIDELGANRFMFGKAAGITVEYSEDAGTTWNTYSLTDYEKHTLFSTGNNYIFAGGKKDRQPTKNDMLRVTIDVDTFGVYTALNKFALFISTGGAFGCFCTIEASLENSPTKFKVFADKVPISGWTGYNIINTENLETYSNAPTRQYGLIRFTFGSTSAPTIEGRLGLAIAKIMAFGSSGWGTPSNMAKTGHLYSYNALQEATFPANVSAPAFIGNLTGTADKAKSDGEGNVITETYAKKNTANKWNALQSFKQVLLGAERYLSTVVSNTNHTPQMSVMHYIAIGTFTLNLQKIEASLEPSNSSVFTAYIESSADYPLRIETAGTIKYIGSASDVAITSAGLLLNIMMLKDASGNLTSIVQASKLS